MKFLDQLPNFLFFTGKGGVGKTSLGCATAVQLADAGKRVLLVSTDPASNVGQVFGIAIGNKITPFESVPRLSGLEIDPQAAAQIYRDKIVGPVRGVLPENVVKGIEEQLSGACTTEIAAFDERIAAVFVGADDLRHDIVAIAQRDDAGDLNRLKHAVIQIALDARQRRDGLRIAYAKAHAPARHRIAFRH